MAESESHMFSLRMRSQGPNPALLNPKPVQERKTDEDTQERPLVRT